MVPEAILVIMTYIMAFGVGMRQEPRGGLTGHNGLIEGFVVLWLWLMRPESAQAPTFRDRPCGQQGKGLNGMDKYGRPSLWGLVGPPCRDA